MQRYFAKTKIDDNIILEQDDIRHIKTVMRMKDNDELLAVLDQRLYRCYLENTLGEINVKIKEELIPEEDFIPSVTLIIPVLKEQKMDYIFQKGTELGVTQFIPFYAERSVIKERLDKNHKKLERWRKIVKEASEQSHRNTVPTITEISNIDNILKMTGKNFVCSTREKSTNIKKVLKTTTKCDRINLVIGPEGGLSEKEENMLIKNQFIPVTFGNRILRVETVPLFLMSIVNYEFME